MMICGACGARVLADQAVCTACGRDTHQGSKTVPALPDELFWVQVRAQFQCQRCRHSSPLNHPDVDGTFECVHCQLEQPASSAVWQEGLRFAHAVADIGSPGADLREPPIDTTKSHNFQLEGLGVTRSSASLHTRMTYESDVHYERHSLEVEASAGHPLCERCAEPLRAEPGADGALRTTCPGCGDQAAYTLDSRLRQLHPGLVGVCASDLRRDRALVRLGPVAGREAVAVQCPQCGAALDLTARDHFVECRYCRTPSSVPAKVKRQLFPNSALVERWWLLFRGVAPEREAALEGLLEEAEEEREEEAERVEREREQAQLERAERVAAKKQRADARRLNIVLGCVLAVCATAVVVAVLLLPKETENEPSGSHAAPPGASAEAEAPR